MVRKRFRKSRIVALGILLAFTFGIALAGYLVADGPVELWSKVSVVQQSVGGYPPNGLGVYSRNGSTLLIRVCRSGLPDELYLVDLQERRISLIALDQVRSYIGGVAMVRRPLDRGLPLGKDTDSEFDPKLVIEQYTDEPRRQLHIDFASMSSGRVELVVAAPPGTG